MKFVEHLFKEKKYDISEIKATMSFEKKSWKNSGRLHQATTAPHTEPCTSIWCEENEKKTKTDLHYTVSIFLHQYFAPNIGWSTPPKKQFSGFVPGFRKDF